MATHSGSDPGPFRGFETLEPRLLLSALALDNPDDPQQLLAPAEGSMATMLSALSSQVESYTGLRSLAPVAGDTATLASGASPQIDGEFLAVASTSTDDGGVVIDSATSGVKWVRQFAHTVADPIKLDWFERSDWLPGQTISARLIQDGDDITGVLNQLRDRYASGGKLHVMAPTIANGTFYSGIVDFRQVGTATFITNFSYLESSVRTTLHQQIPTYYANLQNQVWEQIDENGNPTASTTYRWRTPVPEKIWQLFVSRTASQPPQSWSYPVNSFAELKHYEGIGEDYKTWTCLEVDGQWYLAIYHDNGPYDGVSANYGPPSTWASIEGANNDMISMWAFSNMATLNLGGDNLNLEMVGLYRHEMTWSYAGTNYEAGSRGRFDDVNFRKSGHPANANPMLVFNQVPNITANASAMIYSKSSGTAARNWSIKLDVRDTFWNFLSDYVSPGIATRVTLAVDGTWRNAAHWTGVLFDGTTTTGPNAKVQDPYIRNAGWLGDPQGTTDGSLGFTRNGVGMPGEPIMGEYGHVVGSPGFIFGPQDQRTGTMVPTSNLGWTRSGNVWSATIGTPVLEMREFSFVNGSRKWMQVSGTPLLPYQWNWSDGVIRVYSEVSPASLSSGTLTVDFRIGQSKDIGWSESGVKVTYSSSGLKVDGGSGVPNGTASLMRSLPGDVGWPIFPGRMWAWEASNDSNAESDGVTWTYGNTIWNLTGLGTSQWEQDTTYPNVWKLRLDRDTANNLRLDNGGYVLGRANAALINGIKYNRVGSTSSAQLSLVNSPYSFQSWGPIVPTAAQNAWIAVYSPDGNPGAVFDQIIVSGRNREGYTTSTFNIILDNARGDRVDFPMTYDDQALDFIFGIHYSGLHGLSQQDHFAPEGNISDADGYNNITLHERNTVEQLWGDRISLMKWSSVTRSGEKSYFGPTYVRGPRHNTVRDVKIRNLNIAEAAKDNTFENIEFTANTGATFLTINSVNGLPSVIDMTGVKAVPGSKIVVTGGPASNIQLTINGRLITFSFTKEYIWTAEDNDYKPPAAVVGRHIFYNNSYFDGNNPGHGATNDAAIATDKQALMPGDYTSFANYTSYIRGINGIMVDILNLRAPAELTTADFQFKVGNDDAPGSWATAPAPLSVSVRLGEGVEDSDRVEIIWTDGAIKGKWLEVTVRATGITGLVNNDTFYFGNAPGETGNDPQSAIVNLDDATATQENPKTIFNRAPIDDPYDFNRDGLVNATDTIIARDNQTDETTALFMVTPSPTPDGAETFNADHAGWSTDTLASLAWKAAGGIDGTAYIEVSRTSYTAVGGAIADANASGGVFAGDWIARHGTGLLQITFWVKNTSPLLPGQSYNTTRTVAFQISYLPPGAPVSQYHTWQKQDVDATVRFTDQWQQVSFTIDPTWTKEQAQANNWFNITSAYQIPWTELLTKVTRIRILPSGSLVVGGSGTPTQENAPRWGLDDFSVAPVPLGVVAPAEPVSDPIVTDEPQSSPPDEGEPESPALPTPEDPVPASPPDEVEESEPVASDPVVPDGTGDSDDPSSPTPPTDPAQEPAPTTPVEEDPPATQPEPEPEPEPAPAPTPAPDKQPPGQSKDKKQPKGKSTTSTSVVILTQPDERDSTVVVMDPTASSVENSTTTAVAEEQDDPTLIREWDDDAGQTVDLLTMVEPQIAVAVEVVPVKKIKRVKRNKK